MRGVIAAGSVATAEAGARILRAGGNAVDAAVAAAFASFISEASISAIGGGGFALLQQPGATPVLYDFFCSMPGEGLPRSAYNNLDFTAVPIDFGGRIDQYYVGRGSTAIPGNPAGLAQLLATAGSLPLDVILQPAIEMARDGVVITSGQDHVMRSVENVLIYDDSSRAIFAPGGRPLGTGDVLKNPAFADTLDYLARAGLRDLYEGELAATLVADQQANGGLITQADLANYQVIQRQPLHVTYRGHTLYTNPPPSVGGSLVALGLKLLEQIDLGAYSFHNTEHLLLLGVLIQQTVIARRRDNPQHLVDPAQWGAWLADTRIRQDWDHLRERMRHFVEPPIPGEPDGHGSTTHISALDANGLAVSITTTPGATAGYTVADTGMTMNNNLGEWDLNPAGFHKAAPGTRLSSMMSPCLILTRDGRQVVLGSAGSNRIRSALIQVASNIVDWGLPLENAVNAPRVHFYQNMLELEGGIEPEKASELDRRGYKTKLWQGLNLYFGGTNVVISHPDGRLEGAGDVRRGAGAVLVD